MTSGNDLLQEYKNIVDDNFIVSKTDIKGNIIYVNQKFCEISGYSDSELLGKPHNIVRHPDMASASFKEMWSTILDKRTWRGRITNLNKNGKSYIVESVVSPLLYPDGSIKEFMAVRYDVTEFVEVGQKLFDEKRVREQQKLENEMLQKINKAKESFLLIFTHELKTPLNAIINFADYLRKQIIKTNLENAPKLSELATLIRDNGYDMLNTVTTLLDLAKLTSHHLKFKPVPFNLQTMIENQIQRSKSLTDQNNIAITISGFSKTIEVINDEERVRQIFSNIFSNAIKYGGNQILISCGQIDSDFWFSIDDNGPGVLNKESIFELFDQDQENDLTRTATGTGIGLYFVKIISDQLGLKVNVDRSSSLGGASFVIRGPLLFNPKGIS